MGRGRPKRADSQPGKSDARSFEAPLWAAADKLRRLLQGNIRARERLNIVEARKLSERLDDVLARYHNRAVDSLQVIDELISLAQEVSASNKRGAELGMTPEEVAFYDALAENGSAKALMEHEQLRFLAQSLV